VDIFQFRLKICEFGFSGCLILRRRLRLDVRERASSTFNESVLRVKFTPTNPLDRRTSLNTASVGPDKRTGNPVHSNSCRSSSAVRRIYRL